TGECECARMGRANGTHEWDARMGRANGAREWDARLYVTRVIVEIERLLCDVGRDRELLPRLRPLVGSSRERIWRYDRDAAALHLSRLGRSSLICSWRAIASESSTAITREEKRSELTRASEVERRRKMRAFNRSLCAE